jgi:hypothetical protein
MKNTLAILSALSALGLAACAGEIGSSGDDDSGSDDGSGSDNPVTCEQARSYVGFGGPLEGDRPTIAAGSDRMRIKPFAVLAPEYNRALGITGFTTNAYASTFGKPPARWYQEPLASANTVYAAFALAYDGCSEKTSTGADFAMAPSDTVADRLCRDFARAAWQREATDAETAACVTYATTKTNPADDTRVRWAYTCAAVLSASGFLAY